MHSTNLGLIVLTCKILHQTTFLLCMEKEMRYAFIFQSTVVTFILRIHFECFQFLFHWVDLMQWFP